MTDGHRRLRATLYAIEHLGAEIKSVPVQTEDRYASEAERVLSQIVRNNGKPLNPIEQSRVFKRLIDLGWTEKQIAESTGRSVPWVKGLLELNAAPTAVTAMVRSGQVSATLAMSTLRDAKGDGEKAADVLTGAVEKAAAVGKKKATKKHVEVVDAPERKTLAELAELLMKAKARFGNATIKHAQSGDQYRILGYHFREHDMVLCVEYSPFGEYFDLVKFSRPLSEMNFNQRFIFVEADEQSDFDL